jgi:hypothetical protein
VTKYRISSWAYTDNVLCLFCHESQEHLFFSFSFFFFSVGLV